MLGDYFKMFSSQYHALSLTVIVNINVGTKARTQNNFYEKFQNIRSGFCLFKLH